METKDQSNAREADSGSLLMIICQIPMFLLLLARAILQGNLGIAIILALLVLLTIISLAVIIKCDYDSTEIKAFKDIRNQGNTGFAEMTEIPEIPEMSKIPEIPEWPGWPECNPTPNGSPIRVIAPRETKKEATENGTRTESRTKTIKEGLKVMHYLFECTTCGHKWIADTNNKELKVADLSVAKAFMQCPNCVEQGWDICSLGTVGSRISELEARRLEA